MCFKNSMLFLKYIINLIYYIKIYFILIIKKL